MHLQRRSRRVVAVTAAGAVGLGGLLTAVTPVVSSAADGVNLALPANGGVVSASGNEVADGRWTYQMATDGDEATRWSSNASDSAWIQVKLAQPTKVDHVTIKWEDACAARYKLQVSEDGQTWTDATGVIAPTCASTDRQQLNAATAGQSHSYVRMQALDRTPIDGSKWGVSLYEFEVWNGAEPTPVVSDVNLVPLPSELSEDGGDPYVLTADTSIVATGDAKPVAELLAKELRESTGFALPVVANASGNTITFALDGDYEPLAGPSPEDAYDLVTAPGAVTITAGDPHGLFNGAQTLRQLFPPTVFANEVLIRTW